MFSSFFTRRERKKKEKEERLGGFACRIVLECGPPSVPAWCLGTPRGDGRRWGTAMAAGVLIAESVPSSRFDPICAIRIVKRRLRLRCGLDTDHLVPLLQTPPPRVLPQAARTWKEISLQQTRFSRVFRVYHFFGGKQRRFTGLKSWDVCIAVTIATENGMHL